MKYAVIDIGSNSVRLLFQSGGKTLYKELNTTRLGEGLANTGRLSVAAMHRTAFVVRDFKQQALREGAVEIWAFATAAVRSAENGNDFISLVKEVASITVDVVSGEEEASIGLLGALGYADGGIIDIGGGSTELTLRQKGVVSYSKSINIGAVRLLDTCGRDKERLKKTIEQKISEFDKLNCSVPVYGIGGTATSLAALALKLKRYDGAKVQDFVLTKDILDKLVEEISSITPEELVQASCLPLKRAEIIFGGALLLSKMMEYFNLSSVVISEKDNLEGYLLKRLSSL